MYGKNVVINESFKKYSDYLYDHGVKNCGFMHNLFDYRLATIDPWRDDLSNDIKYRVWNECRKNIWYYFAIMKIMYVEEKIPFELNIVNCPMIYLSQFNKNMFVEGRRQCGKDTTAMALIYHNYLFNHSKSDILAKSDNDFKQMKLSLENICLPEYIVQISKDQYEHISKYYNKSYDENLYKDNNCIEQYDGKQYQNYRDGIILLPDFEFINTEDSEIENLFTVYTSSIKNYADCNYLLDSDKISSIIYTSVISNNVGSYTHVASVKYYSIPWKIEYYDRLPQYQNNFYIFSTVEDFEYYNKSYGNNEEEIEIKFRKMLDYNEDVLKREAYLSRD